MGGVGGVVSPERVSDLAELGAFVLLAAFLWFVWWPLVFLAGAAYLGLVSLSLGGRSDESAETRGRP